MDYSISCVCAVYGVHQVLLGAVELERSAAGTQLTHMEAVVQDIAGRLSGSQLAIPAGELARANKAAVAIQRVVRGNAARKE